MGAVAAAGALDVLEVTFAASVLTLVGRVRLNIAIAGHQVSVVFFSRFVSGIEARAT